jgi:hypothetical protein
VRSLQLALSLSDLADRVKTVGTYVGPIAAIITAGLKVYDLFVTRQRQWLKVRRYDNQVSVWFVQREKQDDKVTVVRVVIVNGRIFRMIHRAFHPFDRTYRYVPVELAKWDGLTGLSTTTPFDEKWPLPQQAVRLDRLRPWRGFDTRPLKPRYARVQAMRQGRRTMYLRIRRSPGSLSPSKDG